MSSPASSRSWIALLLAPVAVAGAWWCRAGLDVSDPPSRGPRSALVQSGIDPNAAPWWELAALPAIGEVTAKQIVAFREAARVTASAPAAGPVFTCPADLDRVPGIGPQTVRRIAPYLAF